jgi:catechol 2,3-dioxygenase-like lactoylglutathione lyase family enzyme
MPVAFNHTIVHSRDPHASARFLAEVLGRPEPTRFSAFWVVGLEHEASLDFIEAGEGPVSPRHFAFLVGEADFDAIFARIRERRLAYWADPFRRRPGEINRNDGGRGVYFPDPDGHLLEILTRPYGSAGWSGSAPDVG